MRVDSGNEASPSTSDCRALIASGHTITHVFDVGSIIVAPAGEIGEGCGFGTGSSNLVDQAI